MPEIKHFVDIGGLKRFKTKQDAYNVDKFLGIHAKADTAGAADTAKKLEQEVKINGVTFDGSKDITIEDSTKLTLSDAEKLYLKKADADLAYLPLHGIADTARKLETPVKINGVSFDGSQSITIEDDTKLPLHGKADSAKEAEHAVNSDYANDAATARKLATAVTINGVDFDGSKNITINAVDSTPRIATSEKGVPNGVATLGEDGKVLSTQLPSYVDDVKEYDSLTNFPTNGEKDKIYVAIDTGNIYRWSGSMYVQINNNVGTSDAATKLATPRKIAGVLFDGTADIEIPAANVGAYTTTEVDDAFLKKEDAANTYVAKVEGKDLSDENFTAELLAKLNGIEEGANKYVLPQATEDTLGGVTIGDNVSVVNGKVSITKDNVIAALGYTPTDSAAELPVEAITDTEIDALFVEDTTGGDTTGG